MLKGETTNTNFIVLALTHTWWAHYTTDSVWLTRLWPTHVVSTLHHRCVWVKALLIRQNRWCGVLTTCVGQSLVNQMESVDTTDSVWLTRLWPTHVVSTLHHRFCLINKALTHTRGEHTTQNRWCSVLTTCVGQSLVNQTESVVWCAHHVCGSKPC
jgi:hypothetical protein